MRSEQPIVRPAVRLSASKAPRIPLSKRLAAISAHPMEALRPYPGPPKPLAVLIAGLMLGAAAWNWVLPRHSFLGLLLLLAGALMAGLAAGRS